MLEGGGCVYSAAGLEIEPAFADTPSTWFFRGAAQCVHWFTLLSYLVAGVHTNSPTCIGHPPSKRVPSLDPQPGPPLRCAFHAPRKPRVSIHGHPLAACGEPM